MVGLTRSNNKIQNFLYITVLYLSFVYADSL